jgi:uncharacterized protein YkwD
MRSVRSWAWPVLVLLVSCVPAQPPSTDNGTPRAPAPASQAGQVAEDLVDLTNVERSRAGLPGLRANSKLMRAAQIQAEQVAKARRLDHVLPEAEYPRPEDRVDATGYVWQALAENLSFNDRTAAEAVRSWMNSTGHRANILNAKYTEIGAGYALDAAGQPYYVQVFARPAL